MDFMKKIAFLSHSYAEYIIMSEQEQVEYNWEAIMGDSDQVQ